MLNPSMVSIVSGIAVLTNRFVTALVTPLFDKYQWERLYIMYIAWALSGVIVWLTGVNLFVTLFEEKYVMVGKILTAIIAGGGANLLHDLTDKKDLKIALLGDPEDQA